MIMSLNIYVLFLTTIFYIINNSKLSEVTENIDTVTENGVQLASGKISEAEIVVIVTGLNLLQLGGINIVVDGKPINIANTCVYKGVMYSGIPNLLNTFGYINAS